MFFKLLFDESIVTWYKTLGTQNVATPLGMRLSFYVYDYGHKLSLLYI